MGKFQYLSLDEIEIICNELENFFNQFNDPPPIYKQSYFDKLDSVLSIPQRTFDGKDLYKGTLRKGACYLYFINKLHPFNNGNKRISIVATGVFLLKNGYELTAQQNTLYEFAKVITTSNDGQEKEFDEVVLFLTKNSRRIFPRLF